MTRVKICGITNLDDAVLAVEAGVDELGFNFYQHSPRYISPESARAVIEKLPVNIVTVGVFVNSSLSEIQAILSLVPLRAVQLHGDERPDLATQLTQQGAVKVIKALRVSESFDPTQAWDYPVDHFLLDADSRAFGGSGETFDWDAAMKFKGMFPDFYLAGGLTPENVGNAIRKVRPYAVDVCTGVELSKGTKDPARVTAFVRNAKNAL